MTDKEVDEKYYRDLAISLVGTDNLELVEDVGVALIKEFRRGMNWLVVRARNHFNGIKLENTIKTNKDN